MKQTGLHELMMDQTDHLDAAQAIGPDQGSSPVYPQSTGGCCTGCAAKAELSSNGIATPTYIYAIGRVEVRFPSLAVKKEFAQVQARVDTAGKSDRAATQAVLSDPANRYLARQLCWILTIESIETYILVPRDPADFEQLLETLRAAPSPIDLDIVIGTRGPIAPPTMCNGLMVPIVVFDKIYSLDRDALIKALPQARTDASVDRTSASELLDRIMLMADNGGTTDEHRALNYLAVRDPAIYTTAADAFARDCSLTAVNVQCSPLSGTRRVVDVIFSFTNRNSDVVEKFLTRVDVTERFPFLVTRMSPYFDR
jgi:cyclic patellamide precursor peptide PatG